jgi:Fe-Mn family superoxide dismutase
MSYAMKSLSCDPTKLKGLSKKLIVSHYENNYGGAVKRLNLIEEKLAELEYASAPGFLIMNQPRRNAKQQGKMMKHLQKQDMTTVPGPFCLAP